MKLLREAAKRSNTKLATAIAEAKVLKDSLGKSLWTSADVSGQNFTLAEVLLEAQRVVRSVLALHWARAGLASSSSTSSVSATIQAIESIVDQLILAITTAKTDTRPRHLAPGPVMIHTAGGEQVINAEGLASNLYAQIEALKGTLPSFLLFPRLEHDVEAHELSLFAEKLEGISRDRADAESALGELRSLRDGAAVLHGQLSDAKSDIDVEGQRLQETLRSLIAEAENAKTGVVTVEGDAKSSLAAAQSSRDAIEALLAESMERHEAIGEFASQLEEVTGRLADVEAKADGAYAKQTGYIAAVEELIRQAEAMVSGATVAGLAKAFADERLSLEKGMKWAMISFFIGIGFIFVVTLILAAYVFELPFSIGSLNLSGPGKTSDLGDEITIAGVLSRTIILLAPFWLTLFSARRYRNLFDLRQQYSHKYNMAFSVDGFKRQAPSYEEQIAAWVFHVVSESPVGGKPRGKGMDENPLPSLEDIVKLPGERFRELLDAAKGKLA